MIEEGKLNFEESNGLAGVEDPSRTEADMTRYEREGLREVSFGKTSMLGDKVPIFKIERNEVVYSSTTKGSKKQLCEPNGEDEKKAFQDLVQSLERMLNE